MTARHDPERRPDDDQAKDRVPEALRQPVTPLTPPPGAYHDIRDRARTRRRSRAVWAGAGVIVACCVAGGAVALNATSDGPASSTVAVGSDASTQQQPGGDTASDSTSKGVDEATAGNGGSTTDHPKSASDTPQTCRTADLKVTLGQGEGAAGSQYRPLRVTNDGSSACSLYGFPGVSMVDGAGKQVGKPADRSGAQASGRVVMKPGQQESVTLRIVNAGNYSGSRCHRKAVAGIRVYPPGERHSVVVHVKGLEGCASSAVGTMTVTSYGVH